MSTADRDEKYTKPEELRRHVEALGWEEGPVSRHKCWIFEHSKFPLSQLVIPYVVDSNWPSAVREVYIRLAETEGRR